MRLLSEFGFYLGFTIVLLVLLLIRNVLWRSAPRSKWAGLLLIMYGVAMGVAIFASFILHASWFEELAYSIENKWLGLAHILGPLIWAMIVAALYDQCFGRPDLEDGTAIPFVSPSDGSTSNVGSGRKDIISLACAVIFVLAGAGTLLLCFFKLKSGTLSVTSMDFWELIAASLFFLAFGVVWLRS